METFKSAIILAGGKSSRMVFDKQCLVINNKRIIYEIAKSLESHFEHVIIVTNKREYYEECKYDIISDEIKEMGPLAGISVGLKHSKSKYAYVVACDMPYIDDNYIKYIKMKINKDIDSMKENDMYICNINNRIQLFQGFYRKKLGCEIGDYLKYSNKKSIISFYERTNKKVNYTTMEEFNKKNLNENIFINLNTKEDVYLYEKEVII